MSKIRVNRIENNSTADGGIDIDTSGHVKVDGLQMPTAGALSGRNLIINGAMRVAQRATSKTGITGSDIHTVDRMFYSETSSGDFVFTQERSTDAPPGFGYSLKITTTTADTSLGSNTEMRALRYKIEGQDLMHLNYGTANAQPLTLSFWVKTSVAGTYTVRFVNNASTLRRYVETYTIAPGEVNTWQYRTVTVNGDTSAGIDNTDTNEFDIFFVIAAGSGRLGGSTGQWNNFTSDVASPGQTANVVGTVDATWQVTGLQLEVGSKATSFEHRTFADDLAKCERYFCKSYNANTNPGTSTSVGIKEIRNYNDTSRSDHGLQADFSVRMRATPTVRLYSKSGTIDKVTAGNTTYGSYVSEITATAHSNHGESGLGGVSLSTSLAATHFAYYHFVADAEI